jgi:thioredoxin reductase
VLVLDTNKPRNASSRALHGFLTRDGIAPRELRRIGRQQLRPYKTVRLVKLEAVRVRRLRHGFEVTCSDGQRLGCRKLLLATGVVDELPQLDGLGPLYGRSVFHCPYCDGWESRDLPLAVYSRSPNGVGLAIELQIWSTDLILCTDGVTLAPRYVERLRQCRIPWIRHRIARLVGRDGQLERIVFVDGKTVERRVLFFSLGQRQSCDLAAQLGCCFTRKGAVRTGEYEASEIPGLYVAGDASRLVQLAIVAAAEGAQAAFAINTVLTSEVAPPVRDAREAAPPAG